MRGGGAYTLRHLGDQADEGRGVGAQLQARDREVGEAVRAEPTLDEVDEPPLGGAKGPVTEPANALGFVVAERRDRLVAVDRERATVILEDGAGGGLRDPGLEGDIGECAAADPPIGRRELSRKRPAHQRAPAMAVAGFVLARS